jgi:hypothetical protein
MPLRRRICGRFAHWLNKPLTHRGLAVRLRCVIFSLFPNILRSGGMAPKCRRVIDAIAHQLFRDFAKLVSKVPPQSCGAL